MISGGVYGDAEQMRTALLLFFDKTRPDMSKGIADVVVFSRYESYDLRSVFKLARRKTIHSTIITLLTGKIGGAPDWRWRFFFVIHGHYERSTMEAF